MKDFWADYAVWYKSISDRAKVMHNVSFGFSQIVEYMPGGIVKYDLAYFLEKCGMNYTILDIVQKSNDLRLTEELETIIKKYVDKRKSELINLWREE